MPVVESHQPACGSSVDSSSVVGVELVLEKTTQTPPVVGTHQPACGSSMDLPLIVGAELVPEKTSQSPSAMGTLLLRLVTPDSPERWLIWYLFLPGFRWGTLVALTVCLK